MTTKEAMTARYPQECMKNPKMELNLLKSKSKKRESKE